MVFVQISSEIGNVITLRRSINKNRQLIFIELTLWVKLYIILQVLIIIIDLWRKKNFLKLSEIQKLRKIEVFITRFWEQIVDSESGRRRNGGRERRESGKMQTKRERRKYGRSEEIKIIILKFERFYFCKLIIGN